ncbi:MAG: peptidoglycan DD-metalloendopeptidase family protein [Rhodospirillales bacterium]|nr:peptidoglycan DD-metalloendopeptidase family protein [Rhodospirillales bacterium]
MIRPSPILPLLLAAAFVAGLAVTRAAGAEEGAERVEDRLNTIERELKQRKERAESLEREAESLKRELGALQKRLVEAGRATQENETQATELESQLADLEKQEAEMRNQLASSHGQHVVVLGALERMARHPPEALIAHPLSSQDLVRSAILLRAAVPGIEERAIRLQNELAVLSQTRADIASRRAELATLARKMEDDRGEIGSMIARKRALQRDAIAARRTETKRLGTLAQEAKDLRELFQQLAREKETRQRAEAERRAAAERTERDSAQKESGERKVAALAAIPRPSGGKPISEARGKLWMPVGGRIVTRYGEKNDTGLSEKGITISTRPNAQVVAPYDGRVAYAGPFRGYGQLLIIEHGEGYHSLIAGLTRIDTVVGQWLLAGEPVGIMEKKARSNPTLYVELRRNGQPINPLPWLATSKSKARG